MNENSHDYARQESVGSKFLDQPYSYDQRSDTFGANLRKATFSDKAYQLPFYPFAPTAAGFLFNLNMGRGETSRWMPLSYGIGHQFGLTLPMPIPGTQFRVQDDIILGSTYRLDVDNPSNNFGGVGTTASDGTLIIAPPQFSNLLLATHPQFLHNFTNVTWKFDGNNSNQLINRVPASTYAQFNATGTVIDAPSGTRYSVAGQNVQLEVSPAASQSGAAQTDLETQQIILKNWWAVSTEANYSGIRFNVNQTLEQYTAGQSNRYPDAQASYYKLQNSVDSAFNQVISAIDAFQTQTYCAYGDAFSQLSTILNTLPDALDFLGVDTNVVTVVQEFTNTINKWMPFALKLSEVVFGEDTGTISSFQVGSVSVNLQTLDFAISPSLYFEEVNSYLPDNLKINYADDNVNLFGETFLTNQPHTEFSEKFLANLTEANNYLPSNLQLIPYTNDAGKISLIELAPGYSITSGNYGVTSSLFKGNLSDYAALSRCLTPDLPATSAAIRLINESLPDSTQINATFADQLDAGLSSAVSEVYSVIDTGLGFLTSFSVGPLSIDLLNGFVGLSLGSLSDYLGGFFPTDIFSYFPSDFALGQEINSLLNFPLTFTLNFKELVNAALDKTGVTSTIVPAAAKSLAGVEITAVLPLLKLTGCLKGMLLPTANQGYTFGTGYSSAGYRYLDRSIFTSAQCPIELLDTTSLIYNNNGTIDNPNGNNPNGNNSSSGGNVDAGNGNNNNNNNDDDETGGSSSNNSNNENGGSSGSGASSGSSFSSFLPTPSYIVTIPTATVDIPISSNNPTALIGSKLIPYGWNIKTDIGLQTYQQLGNSAFVEDAITRRASVNQLCILLAWLVQMPLAVPLLAVSSTLGDKDIPVGYFIEEESEQYDLTTIKQDVDSCYLDESRLIDLFAKLSYSILSIDALITSPKNELERWIKLISPTWLPTFEAVLSGDMADVLVEALYNKSGVDLQQYPMRLVELQQLINAVFNIPPAGYSPTQELYLGCSVRDISKSTFSR